jgi:ABC-type multidrug transport system fused ATPase/permease subunit
MPVLFAPGRRWPLARLVANGAAQLVVAAATAALTQRAFDAMLGYARPGPSLLPVAAGFLLCACALAWLRVRERVDAETAGQSWGAELRRALFAHAASVSPERMRRRRHGSLVVRFVGDLKSLRQMVSLGVARVAVAVPCSLGATVALAVLSPWLGLAAGVAIGAGVAAAFSLNAWARPAIREARKHQARVTAHVSERVAALEVARAFGQVERELGHLDALGRALSRAAVNQARRVAVLRAIADATGTLATAAVLVTGAWLAMNGGLAASTVVAAMTLVGLSAGGLRDLGQVHAVWAQGRVARQKVEEFLAQPTAPRRPVAVDGRGDALRLQVLHAPGRLHAVCARVERGERILVTGASGSGKSSLLLAIAGLLPLEAGRIVVAARGEGRLVALVSAALPLLRGSVEANLRYGNPEATPAQLASIARRLGLDTDGALAEGLATAVSEGGANLPLGVRQRVSLGRALLVAPQVLLLDEIDAGLDASTLARVEAALAAFDGVVIEVSQRPERIVRASRVWTLDAGRIVADDPGPRTAGGARLRLAASSPAPDAAWSTP